MYAERHPGRLFFADHGDRLVMVSRDDDLAEPAQDPAAQPGGGRLLDPGRLVGAGRSACARPGGPPAGPGRTAPFVRFEELVSRRDARPARERRRARRWPGGCCSRCDPAPRPSAGCCVESAAAWLQAQRRVGSGGQATRQSTGTPCATGSRPGEAARARSRPVRRPRRAVGRPAARRRGDALTARCRPDEIVRVPHVQRPDEVGQIRHWTRAEPSHRVGGNIPIKSL